MSSPRVEAGKFLVKANKTPRWLHNKATARRSFVLANAGSSVMIEIVQFLRAVAQRCTTLARQCPDIKTAHGLEELGIELMGKALEIEEQGD